MHQLIYAITFMLLVLAAAFNRTCSSQTLPGQEAFLAEDYRNAITAFESVTGNDDLQNRWGEAFYYIGESYYNIFLSDIENLNMTELRLARDNLRNSISPQNIATLPDKIRNQAHYKLGWCYYRLAEFDDDLDRVISNLNNAYNYFDRVVQQEVTSDAQYPTTRDYALYMKADINIRRVFLQRQKFVNLQPNDLSQYTSYLSDAKSFLNSIQGDELNNYRDYLLLLVDYDFGKLYQNVPGNDSRALNSFGRVSDSADEQNQSQLYLKSRSELNRSIITRSNIDLVYSILESVANEDEKYFCRGSLYQSDFRIDVERFFINPNLLANFARTHYVEKHYWLGWYFYFTGSNTEALASFQNYIDSGDLGNKYLIEDAKLRTIDMRIRKTKNAQVLANYQSELSSLELIRNLNAEDREFLDLWIRVKSTGNLAGLNAPSLISNVTGLAPLNAMQQGEHFGIVRILVRNGVIERKAEYFDVGLRILDADEDISSRDKVNFYKILCNVGKSEMVLASQAPQIRNNVDNLAVDQNSEYYGEAQYLKGYAHYLDDEFPEAIGDLEPLVNDKGNIRAATYLAHAYRKGDRVEDRQLSCRLYNGIMATLVNDPQSYWYREAEQGRLQVTNGCPPPGSDIMGLSNDLFLLTEDGNKISYETLGKEADIKYELAEKMIKIWKLLSLPRLDYYPSIYKFASSRFAQRSFQ
jgi:hypothetical protein